MEMYTFDSEPREVDQHMVNIFGLGHDDLPDACGVTGSMMD